MLIKTGKLIITKITPNCEDVALPIVWDITEDMEIDDDDFDIGIYETLGEMYGLDIDPVETEIEYHYEVKEYAED